MIYFISIQIDYFVTLKIFIYKIKFGTLFDNVYV